ncbi:MAG TPA: carboxypeptidase-like regulatory domain-containing protein, partial [Planctomycetota bacterium]|nr:carboxypeptidase-like regulatory domain-containing protein [Planctomycetota bacterium]
DPPSPAGPRAPVGGGRRAGADGAPDPASDVARRTFVEAPGYHPRYLVRGVARYADGTPAAGAEAALTWSPPTPTLGFEDANVFVLDRARTDSEGVFALEAFDERRLHRVVIKAADGAVGVAHAAPPAEVDVRVAPPAAESLPTPAYDARPLAGRVVRAGSGAPVPFARVAGRRIDLPEDAPPPAEPASFTTTADVDGAWTAAVANGRWAVRAWPPGQGATEEVVGEPDAEPITLTAKAPWRLAGRAVLADGAPVRHLRLRLVFRELPYRPATTLGVRDADGRFELVGDLEGRAWLHVDAAGTADAVAGPFDLAPGVERADLAIRLPEGLLVEGLVRDDGGRPWSGATVTWRQGDVEREGTTDREGRFVFGDVSPSEASVEARHDDASPAAAVAVRPPSTGSLWDVGVLELRRGGAVEGRVLTAAGAPDAAAEVQATEVRTTPGRAFTRSAPTDAEGRYRIGGLPAGTYRVRARKREGTWAISDADRGLAPPLEVRVAPPEAVRVDL